MGSYIAKQVPEKEFKLINGGCPTHAKITRAEAEAAKAAHPEAKFLVHPECIPAVVELADYVGSTTGIMDYAAKSDAKEFIIGTESSIVQHLQFDNPDKLFYPLSKDLVCHNMRLTTLVDVLNCLRGTAGEEIVLDEQTMNGARRCIDEMLRLG